MLGEPFFLDEKRLDCLTSRELWEWYVKPAVERGNKMREEMERARRVGGSEAFAPETPEEIEMAMGMLKAMFGGG